MKPTRRAMLAGLAAAVAASSCGGRAPREDYTRARQGSTCRIAGGMG